MKMTPSNISGDGGKPPMNKRVHPRDMRVGEYGIIVEWEFFPEYKGHIVYKGVDKVKGKSPDGDLIDLCHDDHNDDEEENSWATDLLTDGCFVEIMSKDKAEKLLILHKLER